MDSTRSVMQVLSEAKALAQEYRRLTRKPLSVTGEVAEYEAARILNLDLTPAHNAGYDATEIADGITRRLQIKSRCKSSKIRSGVRWSGPLISRRNLMPCY